MPIEFHCTQCGRMLRTPDDTAGKQAQCPHCGGLTQIPARGAAPAAAQLTPEAPVGSGTTPFGGGQPSGAANPYGAPVYGPADGAAAASRVAGPGTTLVVMGGIGVALELLSLMGSFAMMGPMAAAARHGHGPFLLDIPPSVLIGSSVLGLVLSVLMLVGGLKMKNLDSYGLSMTAAIIALIPCISPCCLFSLPVGIWALVVLNDPLVKSSFRG